MHLPNQPTNSRLHTEMNDLHSLNGDRSKICKSAYLASALQNQTVSSQSSPQECLEFAKLLIYSLHRQGSLHHHTFEMPNEFQRSCACIRPFRPLYGFVSIVVSSSAGERVKRCVLDEIGDPPTQPAWPSGFVVGS